jgi:acylphosphatase
MAGTAVESRDGISAPVSAVRRRIVVRGRVQGVNYRAACAAEARRLGLAGWARNLDDGTVEVVAQGDSAAVGELVAWCRRGPSLARVDAVEVAEQAAIAGERAFTTG